jgi:serine protease Do
MDKAILRTVLPCLLSVLHLSVSQALDSNTKKAVRAATFEFWAPGQRTGAKGLVGTAFAIGPNEFVTAAHLFNTAIGGHFELPVLVDSRRTEYTIADILKFSEREDYVVFSLSRPPRINPFEIRPAQQTTPDLYFAGWHADGTITIEHGTFSGMTRDEQSGQFDWLRFSGPIWGGVGGGPLFDGSGRAVGIVQASARDRGANYALPIGLLADGAPEAASIHAMDMLRSLMPAVSSVEPLKAEIPLPMPLAKFANELQQLRLEYFERVIGPLLDATRRNFVLEGAGAAEVCNLLNGSNCQCKARAGVSGTLLLDQSPPSDLIRKVESSEDAVEQIAGTVVARIRDGSTGAARERDVTNDPRHHLELVLRKQLSAHLPLPVSPKSSSLAGADQDAVYVDFHERAWHLRSWPLLDQDLEVVSLARKVPDGNVILTRIVPASLSYAAQLQLKFLANVIYFECDELAGEGEARMASAAVMPRGSESEGQ